jgi:hypothetical protein
MKNYMKITNSILGLTAGAALLLAGGCSKSEPPSGETPKTPPPVASDLQKAPDAPKPAAEPAPAAATAATDASQAVSAGAGEAQKAIESPKAAAEHTQPAVAAVTEQAVKAAVSQTNATGAAPASQIEGLIYNAKGLVANQQYQDALNVIQQLSSMKLTAEQQKLVDSLKAQIQTALAKVTGSDAASALGNVLGGKK